MGERQPLNLHVTEDKIIDLLLHGATREDISRLDNKITVEIDKLDAKIDKLDAKITTEISKLDLRIDKLDVKIDKVNDKLDKVIWFIIASILIPIAMRVFHI